MKTSKKILSYLQDGGEMPADPAVQGAPAEAAPQRSPEEAMAQMAQQLVDMLMQQIGDPQAVAALLQMALQMVESAAQEAAPVYQRNGGRLVRVK